MRLGIIGAGNMGEAILRGILKGQVMPSEEITIYDTCLEKSGALQKELHVNAAQDMPSLTANSDVLLLAVKPYICENVLSKSRDLLCGKALISIVAGWNRERLENVTGTDVRILRVMPNTPAMVGEGMIAFEQGWTLTAEEYAFAEKLFHAVGKVTDVPEHLMHAVTAVSGSGPAYVYLFIEALADAGVREGLPRKQAYELAAQTVLGSAQMVLETGLHPGELKDRVCSPAGTTIEAVVQLEKNGFRNAVLEAVRACCKKSMEMSK